MKPLCSEVSPRARAQIRALAAVMASNTHSLTAPSVGRRLASQFSDGPAVQREQATG